MAPIRLRFFFDWGTTTCLWADDDRARARFGYAVEPRDGLLAPALAERLEQMAGWHDRFLNGDDPTGPHGRSADECQAFNEAVARLLVALREALGPEVEVVDQSAPVLPDPGAQSPPADLVMVNLQSEVTAPFIAAVADHLRRHAGLAVRFDDGGDWMTRRDAFMRGDVDLALLCGLPYALEADRPVPRFALLAAPVMADARYADQPVYLSDVIVRRESPHHRLADLAGARWAYNEPSSHSGYWLTRHALMRSGLSAPHFGRVIEAGSHLAAIGLVREGAVDAAAIDSTVLELACAADPGLAAELRVIETWGPSAMPPLLASERVSAAMRRTLTEALLAMHHRPEGRAALATGLVSRFAVVTDADYDPIRRMAAIAEDFPLLPT